jgi:hypothetical protein
MLSKTVLHLNMQRCQCEQLVESLVEPLVDLAAAVAVTDPHPLQKPQREKEPS